MLTHPSDVEILKKLNYNSKNICIDGTWNSVWRDLSPWCLRFEISMRLKMLGIVRFKFLVILSIVLDIFSCFQITLCLSFILSTLSVDTSWCGIICLARLDYPMGPSEVNFWKFWGSIPSSKGANGILLISQLRALMSFCSPKTVGYGDSIFVLPVILSRQFFYRMRVNRNLSIGNNKASPVARTNSGILHFLRSTSNSTSKKINYINFQLNYFSIWCLLTS